MAFVGVDLHTDNFTACFLTKDGSKTYKSFVFNNCGIANFKETLSKKDSIAVEAVANAPYFKNSITPYVKNVVIVAPSKFSVIAKSPKKTDKSDAYSLALYLSKKLLPTARIRSEGSRRMLTLVETRYTLVKTSTALKTKHILCLFKKA